MKADVNPCHSKTALLIVTVSVPHTANAKPIHTVKIALYPIIIHFDEKKHNTIDVSNIYSKSI